MQRFGGGQGIHKFGILDVDTWRHTLYILEYMEMYNLAKVTKAIYDSGLKLFTTTSLRNITEISKESSLFNLIKRLIENSVFIKIEKGKYQLTKTNIGS